MTSNYFNTKRPNTQNPKPGYTQRGKIACLSWFSLLSQPPYEGGRDNIVITDPHYFSDPQFNWIDLYALPNTSQAPSTNTGETGASFDIYKPTFFIPGDSPELQAMMEDMQNQDLILLIEDANTPGTNTYLQFGSEANPTHISTCEFTSGTVYGTTSKGWKIEAMSIYRYQYLGFQFVDDSAFSNVFGPQF